LTSAEKAHIDVHRSVPTHLGAIVVHAELDFGWQTMARGAMVSYHFLFPIQCLQSAVINQILMNVKKISMAAITSAPTPLGLMTVNVAQALDLRLIGSLAMVIA
jgi:hypothetical protein